MKDKFIGAIHNKKKIRLDFHSKEDGAVLTRTCAPMDYGPSQRANVKDKSDRFHMWDYDSDEGRHTLSLKEEQIRNIEVLNESFEPREFVKWKTNWIVQRNWGEFS